MRIRGLLALFVMASSLCLLSGPVSAAQVTPEAPLAHPNAAAPPAHTPGGEVNIHLPSLERGSFFGLNGHQLLLGGFGVTFLGRPRSIVAADAL